MEPRHVDVGSARHGYREAGSGAPLVFLHGILCDSRFWEPQLQDLSDAYRVIAWDAPGAGGSDVTDELTSIDGYVASLAAFLDAISASPATLVGLSWGGILALEFYRHHPEAVASLVLADTYAGWKGSLAPEEYESRREAAIEQLESDGVPDEIPGVMHPNARPEAREAQAAMMRDARPEGFRAMGRAMLDVDASDLLERIRVPTLILWGEQDERSPLSVGRTMATSIPGARLATIPGAGHASSLEQPAAFNHALREFLEAGNR